MNQPILNISWGTIFKIFVVVLMGYVLYMVKDILVWLVFAFVIAILFNFIIDPLEKKRVPRIVSAMVLYFAVFALLGFAVYKLAPTFWAEVQDFAQNFPAYLKKISPIFEKLGVHSFKNTQTLVNSFQSSMDTASSSFMGALFSIFGGASATILVVMLAFFISVEKQFVEKILNTFVPEDKKEYAFHLWRRAKKKVSGWFLTRVIGAIFVGAATFIILAILNVKYALLLAIFTGALDFIPVVGPIIGGAILGIVVSLTSSLQALFVIVAYTIVQQLENHLIIPILFRKLMGISPVLVLVALAIGGRLWGVAGAILAIPLAAVLYEVLKDYLQKIKKEKELPVA